MALLPLSSPARYYDPRYGTREQGQMLVIPHVRESDNGEYCCVANNGIGEPAKSCGALQLKMSTSVFLQRLYGPRRSSPDFLNECADVTNSNKNTPNAR